MELKKMTVSEILTLQDQLQKELSSRTNDLFSTLSAIKLIKEKKERTYLFYQKRIVDLQNQNKELNQLEKLGFSLSIDDGKIKIFNPKKDESNNGYFYGCFLTVDMELMVGENQYFEPKDMTKIKQILKLI